MPAYYLACATGQFAPRDLIEQAVAGEQAYFDGICCESAQAWVWLGAAGQATEHVRLGNAVTAPSHPYHPGLDAQAFATLASLFPGRAFLGLGAGESRNGSLAWLEEALELIDRLLAREQQRPPVYVSAFHEEAARVAGRLGDGLWTLADRERAPRLIEAYHEGCAEAGEEPGEILLQLSFSWAETQEQAFEGARVWKPTLVDEFFTDDRHDPAELQEPAQATVTEDELPQPFVVSADPDEHVERIREVEKLGATAVVLTNVSGAAPLEAIRVYGRDVLPKLRG